MSLTVKNVKHSKIISSNNPNPVLFVDVDDTCLELLGGLVMWLNKLNRLKDYKPGKIIKDRSNLHDWLNIPEPLMNTWKHEFTAYSWEWGALNGRADASEAFKVFRYYGWRVIGVGHGASTVDRAVLRRANLELVYPGVFEDYFIAPGDKSFSPYMRDYEDPICITSVVKYAKDMVDAGHITFLLKQPWNKEHKDIRIKSFDNWKQICDNIMANHHKIIKDN